MQTKIQKPGPLLDKNGALTQKGYATSLMLDYDRKAIKAGPTRIKEWDYYLVCNDDWGLALTIDDNSYMGLVSVTLLDFAVPKEHTVSIMTPFPMGKTNMPSTSAKGDTVFSSKRASLAFRHAGGARVLEVEMKNFQDGQTLTAKVELTQEPKDSMVIVTPFKNKPKHFYYNQKLNCLRAQGYAKLGDKTFAFEPDSATAVLDWGRGVWTYSNTWYWGSGSGYVDGVPFGFNLGYGFGDTSAAGENMLFYGGSAHKLEDVAFNIPMEGGREQYTKPWTFTSSDGRFEMDFAPIIDRASNTSALGIIASYQHQVFGRFSGKAVLDGGRVLQLKDFLGFAEKVTNKW